MKNTNEQLLRKYFPTLKLSDRPEIIHIYDKIFGTEDFNGARNRRARSFAQKYYISHDNKDYQSFITFLKIYSLTEVETMIILESMHIQS